MKTSLDWLNQYLDRPATLDEAVDTLTDVGFPEDGVEDVAHANGSTDHRVDFEVTSNRGDCLSHLGLARELAAATGRTLTPPDAQLPEADNAPSVNEATSVENTEPDLCPVYTARVIRGVTVGPSPDWLAQRLEAVGLRPVNNVVDITNFVLLETGQPLHAFDLGKLDGGRIVVRRATAGEKFNAIDGTKHELRDDMLVIADASSAQAVAGVMGGADSEVGDTTTDILLESACFAPLSVRRTSRALKLASDSSFRFERGVDPLGIERASVRAAALIAEIAGGTLANGVIRVGADEPTPQQLTMRTARCNALLGLDLSAQEQAGYLERLGLSPVVDADVIGVTVPSFRLDLKREVDLIEEVARHFGLDRVPMHEKISIVTHRKQDAIAAGQAVGAALVAHGYHETITPSFLPEAHARAFVTAGDALLCVDADRRSSDPYLRPSLLPSLLEVRKLNQDRGNAGVKLYEIADVFARQGDTPHERTALAMLADAEDASAAVRGMRGALEDVLAAVGGPAARGQLRVEPVEGDARYAAAADVKLAGQTIGRLGLLSGAGLKPFGLQASAALLEVDYAPIAALYPPRSGTIDLPRFPAIERDVSIIVAESVRWAQIEELAAGTEPALLESLAFLTTYRGKPIPKGQKSVSFRMVFRDPDATLRHEQVDPQVAAVVEALRRGIDAELRE